LPRPATVAAAAEPVSERKLRRENADMLDPPQLHSSEDDGTSDDFPQALWQSLGRRGWAGACKPITLASEGRGHRLIVVRWRWNASTVTGSQQLFVTMHRRVGLGVAHEQVDQERNADHAR
jgi:hypothetical protein